MMNFDPAACRAAADVPAAVAALLADAAAGRASDVHLLPTPEGLAVRYRVDGRLTERGRFPAAVAANVVGRLKVLAGLLTYDNERPQEGRLQPPEGTGPGAAPQMRLSTFPTIHGEKAVVRLFAPAGALARLDALGLTAEIVAGLRTAAAARGGLVLIAGPAGSGKTTTAYALLRESAEDNGELRSLVTLEDPVESAIPGVSQSQTRPAAGFDFPTGLRSLLRQDPEVLFVGEVRDAETARIALGAALTGHLVFTTFHAGTNRGAAVRLRETGAEAYQIRHGLRATLSQRLLRRLCGCAEPTSAPDARLGLPLPEEVAVKVARGCEECGGTGYRGRFPVAAFDAADGREGFDPDAADDGSRLFDAALAALARGETDPVEVRRVFGFGTFR
ncbi:GspE/PulE family protein [Alienimonas californiensis]|uniref:Type II secretion system protein E n=1 Tax=Alienimonas californiensis TaxID=2527989 RepID=A0A517P982_9PLAN|nr:ATPase, T2SS/T4P/T4SS family [Alienimonas californiensis]QDT15937.1 Type II secretion system protein E [Alienimonas californiensis]